MVVFSDTFIQLDILFICLFVFCVCPNSGKTLMVRRDLLKAVLCYSLHRSQLQWKFEGFFKIYILLWRDWGLNCILLCSSSSLTDLVYLCLQDGFWAVLCTNTLTLSAQTVADILGNPDLCSDLKMCLYVCVSSDGRSEQHLTPFRLWRSWRLVVVWSGLSSAPCTRDRSCGFSVSPATCPSAWSVPPRCTATTAAAPHVMLSIAMGTVSESWLTCTFDPDSSDWRSHCRRWRLPFYWEDIQTFEPVSQYLLSLPALHVYNKWHEIWVAHS